MAYGDGDNWGGETEYQGARVTFRVDFASSSSSVDFEIGANQSATYVAETQRNAWNACYPGEAKLDTNDASIVRYDRNGELPTAMTIKVGSGGQPVPLTDGGPPVQVVLGLTVKNAQ